MLTHGFKYNGNRIADGGICMLFEGVAALIRLQKTGGQAYIVLLNITTITRFFMA